MNYARNFYAKTKLKGSLQKPGKSIIENCSEENIILVNTLNRILNYR